MLYVTNYLERSAKLTNNIRYIEQIIYVRLNAATVRPASPSPRLRGRGRYGDACILIEKYAFKAANESAWIVYGATDAKTQFLFWGVPRTFVISAFGR